MTRFERVVEFARREWGLTLVRNDPKNHGWWSGCWKTGYGLSGNFPGFKHHHRRYRTLTEVAKAIGFNE